MIPHFKQIIEYAAMAPSGHNAQPWKFSAEGHFIKIEPDFNRSLPVADADHHELYISLGCALENLILAAAHFGYSANVHYDFNGNANSILIHLFETETPSEDALFEAIPKRHVNRAHYNPAPIPTDMMEELKTVAKEEDVDLIWITDAGLLEEITALTKEACRLQFANEAYKKELLQWIRFNEKTARSTNDGMLSESLDTLAVPTAVGTFFFEKFVTPRSESNKAEALIENSSALVLFTARENTRENWVKLGRSFERFALAATLKNLSHSHLNMPCETASIREKMKDLLRLQDEPLLLIRIGYALEQMPGSYRRPYEEIISGKLEI